MKTRFRLMAATAVAAFLTTPLAAQDETSSEAAGQPGPETVVAVVDGTEITLGHMALLRAGLPQQYQQIPLPMLFDGILDQLIQQEVLKGTIDEIDAVSQRALENEERAVYANAAIREVAEAALSDEAIQAAYDETYGDAEPETEWNASHILVETEEEAAALAEEARAEGADFAELARENSTGPSGPSGGELGWFSAGQMVPEFQAAVEGLEAGEVSDPVETQFGWHVVRLNDTRDKAVPTLEEVRADIATEVQRAAVEAHIAAITEDAEIEKMTEGLTPEVLNNPALYEQ